jgi:hypothetical protein
MNSTIRMECLKLALERGQGVEEAKLYEDYVSHGLQRKEALPSAGDAYSVGYSEKGQSHDS